MALDLDKDVHINGHTFKAGKNVDTKATDVVDGKPVSNDYSDGIKDILKNDQARVDADETEVDPLEATKKMKGVSQPNPVTEAEAPTYSSNDDAANAGIKEQSNGK